MRYLLQFFTIIIIIPLGLISKLLFYIHSSINDGIIYYKNFIDNSKIEVWRKTFNIESTDSTWEVVNHVSFDWENEEKKICLTYFPDPETDENSITLSLNEKEFVDLLNFSTKLNKTVANNGNTK